MLQEKEILFPSNRRLEEMVKAISDDTKELVRLGRNLAKSQKPEDADAFVGHFLKLSTYQPPEDIAEILSTYTKDFEQWWRVSRPNINEW